MSRTPRIPDNKIIGQRFGKLTVTSILHNGGRRLAFCTCDCGGTVERPVRELRATSGCSASCAHFRADSERQILIQSRKANRSTSHVCPVCLDDFFPARANQKTCTPACQKVWLGTHKHSGLRKSVCENPNCRRVFRHNCVGKKYCSWECHDAVYAVHKAEREHEKTTNNIGRIFFSVFRRAARLGGVGVV